MVVVNVGEAPASMPLLAEKLDLKSLPEKQLFGAAQFEGSAEETELTVRLKARSGCILGH